MNAPRTARCLAPVSLAMLLLAALAGCVPTPASDGGPPSATPGGPAYVGVVRVDGFDLWRGQNAGALLLDVRGLDEWEGPLGHFPEAKLVPLPELEARIEELAAFRDRPVLVYCFSGPRSVTGAQVLARHGFRQVSYLDGGLDGYRKWQAGQ